MTFNYLPYRLFIYQPYCLFFMPFMHVIKYGHALWPFQYFSCLIFYFLVVNFSSTSCLSFWYIYYIVYHQPCFCCEKILFSTYNVHVFQQAIESHVYPLLIQGACLYMSLQTQSTFTFTIVVLFTGCQSQRQYYL